MLIYQKTNKLKTIKKLRNNCNYVELNLDLNATHYLIYDISKNLIGCVSYVFKNDCIYIFGICLIQTCYKNDIILYIKNQTKQFNCEFKVI